MYKSERGIIAKPDVRPVNPDNYVHPQPDVQNVVK